MAVFLEVIQVTFPLLVLPLSSWKMVFKASYVDQQIAAAGAWKSILGIHPRMSPLYPSFLSTVRNTSPMEPLLNLSHPQTPCTANLQAERLVANHHSDHLKKLHIKR